MKQILSGHTLIDPMDISDEVLCEIGRFLEEQRNFSISVYKDKCMKRRIAIRIRTCRCSDAAEYLSLLHQRDQELDALKKALTIHVSQFFRNPSVFEKLHAQILPGLFQKAQASQSPLKFWSLGCAGGEEAYSLGILLSENFAHEMRCTPTKIYAADIDADILLDAAHAEYHEDRLTDLPSAIRERYFFPNGTRLQLSRKIRAMVTFHNVNIMDAGTLEPCQLALCRNTLIYFNRSDQEIILRGIAAILPPGGMLVLGKSETLVGEARKNFATVCPVERIYCRL